MQKVMSSACAVVVSAALAAPAAAAVTTYASETAFNGAVGATSLETFNSVVGEPSFQTAPVVVGDLTLTGYGQQFNRNYIDQPPHQYSMFNIDGTTNVNAVTLTNSGFTITFASAIRAFGATFAGLQNDALRTNIIVDGETIAPPILAGEVISFFGFTSTNAFTQVTFVGASGLSDGFGMDNVRYELAGGVPEPATWALMIGGFGLAGASLRRRAKVIV